jgi:hypothetical protein
LFRMGHTTTRENRYKRPANMIERMGTTNRTRSNIVGHANVMPRHQFLPSACTG